MTTEQATAAPRDDIPALARLVDATAVTYLDNAATTLKPWSVIDAVTHYQRDVSANIHRGKHMLSEEASDVFERVRFRVAELIGAQAKEVVFTRNATSALNTVARGLGLSREDLVLVPFDAHHSNLLPWRREATVVPIEVDSDGRIDLDRYAELLGRRPRVVALSHCSNVTGRYAPVQEMAAMAKMAGAIVVLDAAQSAPHRMLRMRQLGVDFAAFSAHKMLGPTGVGVLYGQEAALERLEPLEVGGGTPDWVDAEKVVPRKLPHRLEAGTPDIAGVYGFGAAVDYLERIGFDRIEEHDAALARAAFAEAAARDYLTVLGGTDADDRTPVVSLALRGLTNVGDLARSLSDSYGVMCRSGHMCSQPLVDRDAGGQVLRMSAYLYNSVSEIRSAFAALDECYRLLGAESRSRV